MTKWVLLAVFLLLPVLANVVIVNSNDWKFVLLTMEIAHYQDDDVYFLLSESQSDILAKNLVGQGFVVYEDKNPIVKDYAYYLKTMYGIEADKKDFKNYRDLQEYLLKILDPKDLFVASELEPENTLISVPFAYKKKGIVLFPSSSLFSRLSDFEDLTLIGGINRDYRKELLSVSTLLGKKVNIIDRGSPYSNGIDLLDDWGSTKKVYISTGAFLEPTLLDGGYPLILTGSNGYSDGFIEILQKQGVETVLVIGTELMNVARRIREDSKKEINVIVKYGETYMSAGLAGIPYALSVFRIPIPQPNVTVSEALYDPETHKLYVHYVNYGDGLAYVSTLTRIGKNGRTLTSLKDDEVFLLWPGDEIIRIYSTDLSDYGLSNLEAGINSRFGRYEDFLVNLLDQVVPIKVTKILDRSNLNLERSTYDGSWLRVYVKNPGAVDAFVSGQVTLILDNEPETFQLSGLLIRSGKTGVLKLRIKLNEEELSENSFVDVFLKYGEHQDLQINILNQKVQLEVLKVKLELLAMPVLALLLIIFLTTIVTRMKNRRYYRAGRRISTIKRNIMAPTSSRRKRSSRSSYSRGPRKPRMLR